MPGIKKGDWVRVLPNLEREMERVGFIDTEGWNSFYVGKRFEAYAVWEQDGEWFVTIDLCVEIPITACEVDL